MKLVILDRDGTINADSDDFVKSPEEWLPLPGALEAIARLNHAGWHVVVASNQSGLGRGLFDVASLNAMHTKMHKLLAAQGGRIDAVFYCPHSPTTPAAAASRHRAVRADWRALWRGPERRAHGR
jgi:D-glycero-D-manno-heptose 1,7-bisphosphate phosphatase